VIEKKPKYDCMFMTGSLYLLEAKTTDGTWC